MNSVEICKKNGWKVGDVITGKDAWDTLTIRITAIGISNVLAADEDGYERLMSLQYRDWKKIE
jgi:hypothetical protein